MSETRVKIKSVVENQLPDFIAEENPLLIDFLKQYYISQEYPSGTTDLVQNLDNYIKLDEIFKNVDTCILSSNLSYSETTISVSTSTDKDGKILTGTRGFPERYGILKIDDEIVIVDEVAYGGANNLLVRRAQLGTAVKVHSAGAQVTKIVGSYNIVDNTLNFSDAPYGLNPISTTTGNPDNRDWTGIATHSTFQGRTFVRSGVPLSSNPAYTENYVFDDISDQFTGI